MRLEVDSIKNNPTGYLVTSYVTNEYGRFAVKAFFKSRAEIKDEHIVRKRFAEAFHKKKYRIVKAFEDASKALEVFSL